MRKILNVYELSEIKQKGFVIAGTNEAFDSLNIYEIRSIIGDKIILINENNEDLYLDVLDVEFSNSILNKKNIFILVKPYRQLYEYMKNDKLEAYAEN